MKFLLLYLLVTPVWGAKKIPKNSHPVNHLWGWECNRGYIQHRDDCIKVVVPKHGVLNEDGHTWGCKEGYVKYRDVCQKPKK